MNYININIYLWGTYHPPFWRQGTVPPLGDPGGWSPGRTVNVFVELTFRRKMLHKSQVITLRRKVCIKNYNNLIQENYKEYME